ncbi:MAG: hypothetical protein NZ516_04285 [Raineya sp.]|nr:hypothetical protein [Raineya sp.]
MKILSVEICNIQSLRGKHIIDFTQESLKNAGIILVTGDTGAGKSTIFNSILLALYSATKEHSQNVAEKVVSTDENEAYVRVDFEVSGNKFTAKWHAKKNKKGKFETETWLIDYQDSSKSLVQKNTTEKARKAIQDIIKLEFEQFTRSVMLAQGEFDKFLKSKETEKTAILEKLTNGEIYNKIAENVYERHKTEEQKLKNLQNDLQRLACLSEEEVKNLIEKQEKLKNANKSIKEKLENLDEQIRLAENIKKIENEIEKLKSEEQRQLAYQAEIQKKRDLCQWHEKTTPLHAQWDTLKKLLSKTTEKEKEIQKIEVQIVESAKQLENFKNQLLQAQEKQKEFLQQQEKIEKIISEQIQPLQQKLQILETQKQEKQKFIEDNQKKLQQHTNKLSNKWSASRSLEENQQRIESGKNNLQKIEQFLRQNQETALSAQFNKAQEILLILQSLQEKQNNLQTIQEDLEKTQIKYQETSQELQKLKVDIQETENQISFYQEKVAFEEKIVSLEEYRKKLKPNEPCPLCGSLHHPYAENLPVTNISESEKKLKEAKERLKNLQEKAQKNQSEFLQSQISNLESQIQKLQENIEQEIQRLPLKDFSLNNLAKIIENHKQQQKLLETRLAEVCQKREEKELIQYEIFALEAEYEILDKNAYIQDLQEEIKENQTSIYSKIDECRKLLPDIPFESVDDLIKKLKATHQRFEKNIEEIKNNCRDIEDKITTIKAQSKQIASDLEKEKNEKNQIETQLQQSIEELDLKSIEELETKILPVETFQEYQKEIANYEIHLHRIQSLLRDREEKLQEIKREFANEIDSEKLKQEKESLENQQAENQKELGSIQEKLANNQKNQQEYNRLQNEIEKQSKYLRHWEKLKKILAEPKDRFARIAQSITLEHLIKRANVHLQKLSERYQLQRLNEDNKKSLDLCIVDRFQANNVREVSTLSGGETFLVSLALALGLSDMASKNIEIGMLFIDEGFGTLDANTLDIALNVLETLQNEGKTIVIISHLAEIKERIHTKISVEKTGKGDSKIVIPSASFT